MVRSALWRPRVAALGALEKELVEDRDGRRRAHRETGHESGVPPLCQAVHELIAHGSRDVGVAAADAVEFVAQPFMGQDLGHSYLDQQRLVAVA